VSANAVPLTFGVLLAKLHEVVASIEDPRQKSNGTRYRVQDAVLSAFSTFFMQCSSFLDFQRQVNNHQHRDNVQTLFGVGQIPSDAQIRNILDKLGVSIVIPVFLWIYHALKQGGYLKSYEVLQGQTLLSFDGVEFFRSQSIHCQCCNHCHHSNGEVSYFHRAILPVIVAPGHEQVISLPPEFVTPQDGHDKQDCEIAAAKRWLNAYLCHFDPGRVTLLGDDLYGHQPMCELALAKGVHYLFTCLPQSHASLYEWLTFLDANGEVFNFEQRQWDGKRWLVYTFRYANGVPLRDTQPALAVNWFEMNVTRERDGQSLYCNSFITDHPLHDQVLIEMGQAARARWKSENESHNVLKTKGYHLEHNFGHGAQGLANVLVSLNVLAFLFHTVLALVDASYQRLRQRLGKRVTFFEHLRTLTQYMVFDSWQSLMDFMLERTKPDPLRRSRKILNSS
jgi:hypothetical protein